jgi:hypothetical protein
MARGCGSRSPGGIYIEVLLDPVRGTPLHRFICDPPIPTSPEMGIPNRGVLIQERVIEGEQTGIYDVFDRIGSKHYPNVADMIAEIGTQGLSRRISRNAPLELLDHRSLIILVHERAIIANHEEVYERLIKERTEMAGAHRFRCPCEMPQHVYLPGIGSHDDPIGYARTMCAGLWWEDVVKGTKLNDPTLPPRTVERENGSTLYRARHMVTGVTPLYQEGIFMRLPISRLGVIKDPVSGTDAEALDKASQSGLNVELEDF